jgi:hypothetical protein
MDDFWYAVGRGLIKLLISLFTGLGVGLLVFGINAQDDPSFWRSPYPPAALFISFGAGLLTTTALLVVLFVVPWLWRKPAPLQSSRKDRRAEPFPAADRPREDGSTGITAPPA